MDIAKELKKIIIKMEALEKVEQLIAFHKNGLLSDKELLRMAKEQYIKAGAKQLLRQYAFNPCPTDFNEND